MSVIIMKPKSQNKKDEKLIKDIKKLYKYYGKLENRDIKINGNKIIIRIHGNISNDALNKNIKNYEKLTKKYNIKSILITSR